MGPALVGIAEALRFAPSLSPSPVQDAGLAGTWETLVRKSLWRRLVAPRDRSAVGEAAAQACQAFKETFQNNLLLERERAAPSPEGKDVMTKRIRYRCGMLPALLPAVMGLVACADATDLGAFGAGGAGGEAWGTGASSSSASTGEPTSSSSGSSSGGAGGSAGSATASSSSGAGGDCGGTALSSYDVAADFSAA